MQKSNENGRREILEVIEEIESLEAEKKATGERIKAAYARVEGDNVLVDGLPVSAKAVKQIIKDRGADMDKTAKLRAESDRIVKALGKFADTEHGEWTANQAAAIVSAKNMRPARVKSTDTVQ